MEYVKSIGATITKQRTLVAKPVFSKHMILAWFNMILHDLNII